MNARLQPATMTPADPHPLRVLHAIGSISLARGGSTVALLNTVAGLAHAGVTSEIVTTDDDGDGRRLPGVASSALDSEHGCRARYFPRQTQFYSASWPMLPWLLRNVARYDLVHVHGLFNFAPGAAAFAAAWRGVPYVVQPHGVLERWGREHRRPWLKDNSIRFLEGPLLRRAGAIVFTSAQEQEQAVGLPLPRRHAVIPLAMPESATAPASRDPQFANLAGRPWVLFLGRLDEKKGVETLLSAFAVVRTHIPEAALVIAGDGARGYVDSLRRRARELNLAGSVRWPGFVTGTTKQWLLENCGGFVLASSSENFCLAAVEAMAAGRPVILAAGVAVTEIVARWRAGIVTGLDPREIAAAIRAVLDDPSSAAAMGQRGRAAVREELSLESHGQRLSALYRKVVAGKASPDDGARS